MIRVRPVETEDADNLLRLAEEAGVGLTTLPADLPVIEEHIEDSIRALSRDIKKPKGERYLLVLEDLLNGEILGCAGIKARVGGFEPFYSYAVKTTVKASNELNVHKKIQFLSLKQAHSGPSEVGTLFVKPSARGGGKGRLMSLARFLFMACNRTRFADLVIAEMRGVLDDADQSPFWDAVGRHFFDMDFALADQRSAKDKQFIADLMPKQPIYIPMLPPQVQSLVGDVHPHARPALKLLKDEGFIYADEVDIFDAGPMYFTPTDKVRVISESRCGVFERLIESKLGEPKPFLISSVNAPFHACLTQLEHTTGQHEDNLIGLPRDAALALGVRLGEPVRFVKARSSKQDFLGDA